MLDGSVKTPDQTEETISAEDALKAQIENNSKWRVDNNMSDMEQQKLDALAYLQKKGINTSVIVLKNSVKKK